MARVGNSPFLVTIYCPKCGGKLPEPFARFGGPLVYCHSRGKTQDNKRCRARLLVFPRETRALELDPAESFETALDRAWRDAA